MRNSFFGLSLFLLLLGSCTVFSTDVTACGSLAAGAGTFTLTQDIWQNSSDVCITTGSDSQIIDGAGYAIRSNGSMTYGISSANQYTQVKNIRIYNFTTSGISVASNSQINNVSINTTFLKTSGYAYGIEGSSYSQNIAVGNSSVYINSSTASTTTRAVYLGVGSSNLLIQNMNTSGNAWYGIYPAYQGTNILVTGNFNITAVDSAFIIDAATNASFRNINASIYVFGGGSFGAGIWDAGGNDATSEFRNITIIAPANDALLWRSDTSGFKTINSYFQGARITRSCNGGWMVNSTLVQSGGDQVVWGFEGNGCQFHNNTLIQNANLQVVALYSNWKNTIWINNTFAQKGAYCGFITYIGSGAGDNTQLINNTINGSKDCYGSHGAVSITQGTNITLIGNRITAAGAITTGLEVQTNGNHIYNNTIINLNTTAGMQGVHFTAGGTNNDFLWNNITANIWVNDSGTNNTFNNFSQRINNTYSCDNSSKAQGSCVMIGANDSITWNVTEPNGVPFNATINITNTSFTLGSPLEITIVAGYYYSGGAHEVEWSIWNGTAWVYQGDLGVNALGTNTTYIPSSWASGGKIQMLFNHPDNGNPSHTGLRVDYIGVKYQLDGKGNAYYYPNGTGSWENQSLTSSTGNGYADGGTPLPYNSTNLGTAYWYAGGRDWHPFINQFSAVMIGIVFPTSYSSYGLPYQMMLQSWGYVTAQANFTGTGTSSLNCTRFDTISGQNATISQTPASNTNTTYNFTLNGNNSGVPQLVNCTGCIGTVCKSSRTEAFVVLGVGSAGAGGGTAIIIPQGGNMGEAVPIALFLIGGILIYMAQSYRKNSMITWFELLFALGNIFMLSGVFVLYSTLSASSLPFGNVVLPVFQGFLAIYLIVVFTMLFKLWKILYAWMVEMARRIK